MEFIKITQIAKNHNTTTVLVVKCLKHFDLYEQEIKRMYGSQVVSVRKSSYDAIFDQVKLYDNEKYISLSKFVAYSCRNKYVIIEHMEYIGIKVADLPTNDVRKKPMPYLTVEQAKKITEHFNSIQRLNSFCREKEIWFKVAKSRLKKAGELLKIGKSYFVKKDVGERIDKILEAPNYTTTKK